MNLQISITRDESAALTRLVDAGRKVLAPLARAFGSGAQEVLGRAVRGRFTGKGPFPVSQHRLGVVTNRLRRSMRATAPQVDAATGRISIGMGSNVKYYAGHEFGFRGRVQVKAHTRRTVARGRPSPKGGVTKKEISNRKAAYQRGRSSYSNVRAHTRRVNIPERAPLRTELGSIQTRLTFRQKIVGVIRNLTRREEL